MFILKLNLLSWRRCIVMRTSAGLSQFIITFLNGWEFLMVCWNFAEIGSTPANSVSNIWRAEYWENQVQGFWFGWTSDCSQSLERLLCQGILNFSSLCFPLLLWILHLLPFIIKCFNKIAFCVVVWCLSYNIVTLMFTLTSLTLSFYMLKLILLWLVKVDVGLISLATKSSLVSSCCHKYLCLWSWSSILTCPFSFLAHLNYLLVYFGDVFQSSYHICRSFFLNFIFGKILCFS